MSNQKEKRPLPDPDNFKRWINERFFSSSDGKVNIAHGVGGNWKRQKISSVVSTACHSDIRSEQLKAFHRILLLKALVDSEYSVDPLIYIMALRDIARGYLRGDIEDKVAEASKFLQEVFSPGAEIRTVEDRVEIQKDTRGILLILDYEKSLQNILEQINNPEKLKEAESITLKEKEINLTEYEKELLRIYLFDRGMLQTEMRKYPYISWGLEALADSGISYSIYDKSNAGCSILRKLMCADHNKEYPGTIVLPDPLTVSGKPMRYQVQMRDLRRDNTLFIADSYGDIKLKIYHQKNVSPRFLEYLENGIIRPFASRSIKNELDLKYKHAKRKPTEDNVKRALVLKCYWKFIRPHYNSLERITGAHESLFVPDEFTEKALDALGSKRNRNILREIASYHEKNATGITVDDLFERLVRKGLGKGAKKGLYRNLDNLVKSGLVTKIPEGKRLNKYLIYTKKTAIRIKWVLIKSEEERKA